jgi:hypothetical protein
LSSLSKDNLYNETGNQDVSQNQTVKFDSEAIVVPAQKLEQSVNYQLLRAVSDDDRIHDIKTFINRPVVIATGTFSTTNSVMDLLSTITLPDAIINNPMNVSKISGFYGFRGDMCLRLQMNATRFQQGRLIFHYIPQYATSPVDDQNWNRNLIMITQHPRVDVDISNTQEVILRIPYNSPLEYMNLVSSVGTIATAFLHVYSPLLAPSGSTSANYTIWGHIENPELIFPSTPYTSFTSQSRGRVDAKILRRNMSIQELESDPDFKPSNSVGKLKSFVDTFSSLPLLSPSVRAASWFLSATQKTLSAFGWSKPYIIGNSTRMVHEPYAYCTNSNGADLGKVLGVNNDNEILQTDAFQGTQVDEMSINFVTSIMAYNDHANWTTSVSAGTELKKFPIGPTVLFQQETLGGVAYNYFTPMGYVASAFQFWRGSLNVHIKVIKTEFHTGRLMFVYVPGDTYSNSLAIANTQWLYREIMDLRLSNELCINIPYVAPTPYLPQQSTLGVFRVYVLNALEAPASVSSSVDVIFEWGGGPDFEVAAPQKLNLFPVSFTSAISALDEAAGSTVVTQSAGELDMAKLQQGCFSANSMGGSDMQPVGNLPSAYCMGERILSLRQFLKRFTYLWVSPDSSNVNFNFFPGYLYGALANPSSGSLVKYPFQSSCDMYTYFGSMYIYRKGSVRYKLFSTLDTGTSASISTATIRSSLQNRTGFTGPLFDENSVDSSGLSYAIANVPTNGGIEVVVPHYNNTTSYNQIIWPFTSSVNPTPTYTDGRYVSNVWSNGNQRYSVQRAIGDDFSFGTFINVPPLALISSVRATS